MWGWHQGLEAQVGAQGSWHVLELLAQGCSSEADTPKVQVWVCRKLGKLWVCLNVWGLA